VVLKVVLDVVAKKKFPACADNRIQVRQSLFLETSHSKTNQEKKVGFSISVIDFGARNFLIDSAL
jgi:hypothetical protein